jgi:DNA-binding GntR family transcriptional regulator
LQRWAIKMMTGGAPGSRVRSAEQHEAIFDAIKNGRIEDGERLVKNHIDNTLAAYRQAVRHKLITGEKKEL